MCRLGSAHYMQTIKIHSHETCKSHNSPPFGIIKNWERNNHDKEYIQENVKQTIKRTM